MKDLRIEYDGKVIWDGSVSEFAWSETDSGVKVEGRLQRKPPAGTGNGFGGFLEAIAASQRKQTESVVAQRKKQLEAEKSSALSADVEEVEVDVQT